MDLVPWNPLVRPGWPGFEVSLPFVRFASPRT